MNTLPPIAVPPNIDLHHFIKSDTVLASILSYVARVTHLVSPSLACMGARGRSTYLHARRGTWADGLTNRPRCRRGCGHCSAVGQVLIVTGDIANLPAFTWMHRHPSLATSDFRSCC